MARLKRQETLPLLATLLVLALVLVICLLGLSGAAQAITTTSTLGQTLATQTLTGSAPPTTIPQSSGTQAAPSPLVIHAKAAIVIDMDTGQILYSHNANARRAIASTTKIMTSILTLETLPLNQVVTVSARAANVGEQSLGLKAGERLTVEQLLYGALVHSANDAAFALAEACGGTMEAFVKPESTDTPRGNRGQIEDKCLLFLGECELVEPTSTPRGRHSLDAIFPQSLSPVSSLL